MQAKDKYSFKDLVDIIARLRGPGGCPWDREQTPESLRKYVLEEAYEVIDASSQGGMKLADELGDLLLQIVLQAEIGREEGSFDIDDVISLVCKKMIRRHPHVFGDVAADTPEQVVANWDEIKRQERGTISHTQGIMDIPRCHPSLVRAYKVQQKASKAGFDWDNVRCAIDKAKEELGELAEAIEKGEISNAEKEIGDLLFATVNVARFLDVNPELALAGATERFISRFAYIEEKAGRDGVRLEDMSLEEMDKLWDEAKALERGNKL